MAYCGIQDQDINNIGYKNQLELPPRTRCLTLYDILNLVLKENNMTNNPNRKPSPNSKQFEKKNLFQSIIETDFRWRMKNTGDLVPIERLPDEHWESIINKYKGTDNFKELCINYRQTLKSLNIARDRIDGLKPINTYPLPPF